MASNQISYHQPLHQSQAMAVMGTHYGAVRPTHVPACLDDWVFRFDRRRSKNRGLLFYKLTLSGRRG